MMPYEKRRQRPNAHPQQRQHSFALHAPPLTQAPRREPEEGEQNESDVDTELGERISAMRRKHDNLVHLPPSSPLQSRDSTPTPPERGWEAPEGEDRGAQQTPTGEDEVNAAGERSSDSSAANEDAWRQFADASPPSNNEHSETRERDVSTGICYAVEANSR